MSDEKFDVILADPPWTFSAYNAAKSPKHASHKYDLMSTKDICKLTLPASENCALFLWATWPNIMDAFRVIEAWDFTYRTLAWCWVKLNKRSMSLFTGLGYYTRSNTEPCLLAVRGKMSVQAHDVQAVIVSPVRQHSRKPDEQYPKIERLYPNMRYLEMFARQRRSGWSIWGNEVDSDIEIATRLPR